MAAFMGFRKYLFGRGSTSTFSLSFSGFNGNAEIKAGPSRCGAKCKTWGRGPTQDLGAGPL